MPKTDTGEFELVLGNRQLLSGFAVVAILFGVFFTMGYIVGRNSTPSARVPAEAQVVQPTATQGEMPRGQAPTPAPGAQPAAPAPEGGGPAEAPAPAEPAPRPARVPEAVKPAEKPPEAPPAVQSAEAMPPGTYLQVMAVKKQDADVIASALQGKGFPTLMTPSSREGIFRVLVGPYKDAASLGKAKTELENSGFHPIVQKVAERT